MAIRCFVFALMLVVGCIVVVGNLKGVSAQPECGGDLGAIFTKCDPFIRKEGPQIPPSQACCDELKNVDVICLCNEIPPAIQDQISLEKAIHVARVCGCSVPTGTKCLSYTVPPPESPPVPKN